MQNIFLLRGDESAQADLNEAAEKFKLTQKVALNLHMGKNINEVASKIEAGAMAIIFADCPMEKMEVNLLAGAISRLKKPPFVITIDDNYDLFFSEEVMGGSFKKAYVGKTRDKFTAKFFYNCVRNLLTPPGQKLDIRYIKSIVRAVGEVITSNTSVELQPGDILEVKAQETPETIASVSAFYGDGFLGSITIGTKRELMSIFAQKMLFCEEADVTDEMLIDLTGEVSNQIIGAVRNSLSEFGWALSTSMQTVVIGKDFLNASTSNGRYYHLPFSYEGVKFDLSLCYNTYVTSLHEIEDETGSSGTNCLDVRLVSAAKKSCEKILEQNLNGKLEFSSVVQHTSTIYPSESLQLFHAGGWKGCMIMSLSPSKKLTAKVLKETMGMEEADIEDSMVNDFWGEILNQIAGDFLKLAKASSYSLQRIYQGAFTGGELSYLLKNPGYYFRQDLTIHGSVVELLFGVDSQFSENFFDIWPYFKKQSTFEPRVS